MDDLSICMKIWGIILAVVVIIAILAGVIYTYMRANNNVSTTSSHNLRIISLAPSDTQVLIALGLGKYIVGIDYYSYSLLKYLNLTSQVPANVTVFSQIYPPNISGLLLLHPSIVVVEYGLEAPYISQMEKAGLNVLVTNSDYAYSFSQIEENIMEIAKYFNVTQQGEELINWMNEKIADFSTLGNTTIAYMLYICPNLDFYTAGGNVFINSIIVQGGGINVFSTYSDYPLLSPDELLVSNPQVIIAQEVSNFSYTESLISQIPGIKNVKAFNASRIYILGNLATDLLNEPGPLSVYAILMVHDIINSTTPKYVTASWVKENLNIELPIF
ncbi:ABC transporter substrate-binding protein [Sulfurisphaera ohwakuensis]|uniref:ABC transporter substrate-binding protein n=2 Tax=Sulfurisphaera ohwakuensis TaxID=69656 RepID=A0A650CFR8_SULOH|nr:ABC transporter substrate-binding protein [Sulfurisphaera ohwakuensis]